MLAGIGFTVALFIAGLAFPTHPEFADRAKVGIFVGSAVAGVMGYLMLRQIKPSKNPDDDVPTETKAARV
jgi:NhaA family Na+:H+ antiporter